MAKRDNTRERILAIERMFLPGQPLTTPQIIQSLDLKYDIQVGRKTVYQDIAVLGKFMNICTGGRGVTHFYQLVYLDDLLKD